jgi:phage gpG-like protein
MITLLPTNDGITPALARKLVLSDIGTALVSLAKRAHSMPGLRPAPWPALRGGGQSQLQRRQQLRQSTRVTAVNARSVEVGARAVYGEIHEFGGQTGPHVIRARRKKALAWGGGKFAKSVKHPGSRIPARPRFPFAGGRLTARGLEAVQDVIDAALK